MTTTTAAATHGQTGAHLAMHRMIIASGDPVWLPYAEGCLFFRAMEEALGREAVDAFLDSLRTARLPASEHSLRLRLRQTAGPAAVRHYDEWSRARALGGTR